VNKLRTYSFGGIECASRRFFSSKMRIMCQREQLSLNKCESSVLLLQGELEEREVRLCKHLPFFGTSTHDHQKCARKCIRLGI
jgi:hypothetical protein